MPHRKYREHLDLFQLKETDRIQIETNKRNAAINTAQRHVTEGKRSMPHVVDRAYRAVYLEEYDRASKLASVV